MKTIYLDSKQIKFFKVTNKGWIRDHGDEYRKDWDDVKIDLNTLQVGKCPSITFNDIIWTDLKYKVIKIE